MRQECGNFAHREFGWSGEMGIEGNDWVLMKTARAPSNIAVIKYWGKRDENLILPINSSISVTLDYLFATTTVAVSPSFTSDRLWLNGKVIVIMVCFFRRMVGAAVQLRAFLVDFAICQFCCQRLAKLSAEVLCEKSLSSVVWRLLYLQRRKFDLSRTDVVED